MENIIKNGDYVSNGRGGIEQAEAEQALLCRALFRLCCRRGSFPFLPELGSRLWQLKGSKREQIEPLAMAYAAEAVAPLGLLVKGVTVAEQTQSRLRLDVQLATAQGTQLVEVYV